MLQIEEINSVCQEPALISDVHVNHLDCSLLLSFELLLKFHIHFRQYRSQLTLRLDKHQDHLGARQPQQK